MFIGFKFPKVFYSPDDNSGISTDNVDMPDDRAILDSEDDDEQISDGEGEDEEGQDEEEGKERSSSKRRGSKESDGSGDEEVEDIEDPNPDEDEEEQDEDEEDEETEEEDDDVLNTADLVKAVKKASPELFKKIPGLREALQREQEYTEIVPTIEDAKIAVKNSAFLKEMYSDISSGDVDKTTRFLKAIKETNEEALEDFSHTFLDSVAKLSPDLYGQVMGKPISLALKSAYVAASKAGNKNLAASAIWLYDHFFDTKDIKSELESPRKKVEKTKEQQEWEKEKEQFETTTHQNFIGSVTEVINHSMKLSISKHFDGLNLNDYQKRNLTKDIFQEVDKILGEDKRYLAGVDSLVKQAKSAKYSPEWKTKVVKAYLSRSRQSLDSAVNKIFKIAGIKSKATTKSSEPRRIVPAGLGGGDKRDSIDISRIDKSKTSDMDILNGRVTYKK